MLAEHVDAASRAVSWGERERVVLLRADADATVPTRGM
jgi:hypothetical protein